MTDGLHLAKIKWYNSSVMRILSRFFNTQAFSLSGLIHARSLMLNCPYGLPGVSCGFKHNNEVEESGMASNMDCGPI